MDCTVIVTKWVKDEAFFLAPFYANWCLNNMLQDSKKMLEANQKIK